MSDSTGNDEAIARALAREEQERSDASLARRLQEQQQGVGAGTMPGNDAIVIDDNDDRPSRPVVHAANTNHNNRQQQQAPLNCPGGHGLNEFLVSYAQRVDCAVCHRRLKRDERAFGCVVCHYDVCAACCLGRFGQRPLPPQRVSRRSFPMPAPFPGNGLIMPQRPHMCIAPCVIGHADDQFTSSTDGATTSAGVCVEMMIDTGAQSSVISLALARRLNLEHRIDRRQQGVAAGVGRAKIVGTIHNLICELGHVEFGLSFAVLDVPDQLLLLGLDLMRQYKCIVDLERDVLIFGGKGGVEVPMLPADEQHVVAMRNQLGCPMM